MGEFSVSDDLPRSVRDDPWTEVASDQVSLQEGEQMFLVAVRRDFVGNEKRQQTADGAATINIVATPQELADAAGRDEANMMNNKTPHFMDRAGLALRVPNIERSSNDQALFGFCDEHRGLLRTISKADADHELQLPDDERARRMVAYVGAELIAEERAKGTLAGSDRGEAPQESAADTMDNAESDEFSELRDALGLEDEVDPEALSESIQEVLDSGIVSWLADLIDQDEATLRRGLKDARYKLNLWRYRQLLNEDGPSSAASDDTTEREAETPAPDDGVLGYDWVSTADRSWSGRPLRSLLYALLTESSGPLPDEAIDRIELVNYGEPTVEGSDLPRGNEPVTLKSDRDPPGDPEKTDQHAIDFCVVGDLFNAAPKAEQRVKDALEQYLNGLHMMARYDASMCEDPTGVDREAGADPRGDKDGMTAWAASHQENLDREVPFDEVPEALVESMKAVEDDLRNDDLDIDVYSMDNAIIGTSRSTS